jgi:hypothetical protein
LEEDYLPRIKRYQEVMDQLELSNQQCREAAVRIDGALALKLNRSEILGIHHEFKQAYLTRDDYDRFEGLQDQLKDRISNMEHKFTHEVEEFTRSAELVTYQMIEDQMETKF